MYSIYRGNLPGRYLAHYTNVLHSEVVLPSDILLMTPLGWVVVIMLKGREDRATCHEHEVHTYVT